jgi:hypothetical protein
MLRGDERLCAQHLKNVISAFTAIGFNLTVAKQMGAPNHQNDSGVPLSESDEILANLL